MKDKKIIIPLLILICFIITVFVYIKTANKNEELYNNYSSTENKIEYTYESSEDLDNEDVANLYAEFVNAYTSKDDTKMLNMAVRKYEEDDYYITSSYSNNTWSEFWYNCGNSLGKVYNKMAETIFTWP